MSDYTPSTEEIRRDYVACNSSPQASMSDDDLVPIYVSRKWFDRWLAAHDREVDGDFGPYTKKGLQSLLAR